MLTKVLKPSRMLMSRQFSKYNSEGLYDPVEIDANKNKYQTPQMLFFQD